MKKYLGVLLRSQIIALCLLFLLLYPQQGLVWKIVWALGAIIFIFFLPGYWVSLLFFDTHELSDFERFITSLALSLGVIVFASFYLHYFGIAVYPIHIFVLSCTVMVIAWFLLFFRHRTFIHKQE